MKFNAFAIFSQSKGFYHAGSMSDYDGDYRVHEWSVKDDVDGIIDYYATSDAANDALNVMKQEYKNTCTSCPEDACVVAIEIMIKRTTAGM